MTDGRGKRLKIWSAWLQGRNSAPENVQRILALWERLHPQADFQVVDAQQAKDILASVGLTGRDFSPQVTANIVRSVLLSSKGGAWVDATLLPTRPLDDWLKDDIIAAGFFAFRSTGDPNLVLQNWFLYSEPGNPLIVAWTKAYIDYFRANRIYPSFKAALKRGALFDYLAYRRAFAKRDTLWFVDPDRGLNSRVYPYAAHNYNLAFLLQHNAQARDVWNNVPHRSHILPTLINILSNDPDTSADTFKCSSIEALSIAPVHKLNSHDRRFLDVIKFVEDRL